MKNIHKKHLHANHVPSQMFLPHENMFLYGMDQICTTVCCKYGNIFSCCLYLAVPSMLVIGHLRYVVYL